MEGKRVDPLVVPARLESLQAIRNHVQSAAGEAELDKKDAYRLVLAVDEIATNIITHGYAEAGRDGSVALSTEIDTDRLTVALEDTGVPFNPNDVAEPDLDQPVTERKVGGMGVYLAIRGVDSFRYERDGEMNRNTFVMNRKRDQTPGS